jgi:UDPglucose 6-dehydrogenase
MKLTVVGTGYVGLVAGAAFASAGHRVTCVDIDVGKIARLRAGEIPIHEPGLSPLVAATTGSGHLTFDDDVTAAVRDSEVVFICVGTPSAPDGSADLSYVLAAAGAIARGLTRWAVIAIKSTVPVGTGARVAAAIAAATAVPFAMASNPEFQRQGSAVHDFLHPDRVVIGSDDARALAVLTELYTPLCDRPERIVTMDTASSELTKYAANAMLATRISFMNELANLCERVSADVEAIRRGIGSDPRIGPAFLAAGVGYGGSCFPKDVQAAIAFGRDAGVRLSLLEAVHEANTRQQQRFAERVLARFGGDVSGRCFAAWGLSFKQDTDDLRSAPSIGVLRRLLHAGARVRAYDPVAAGAAHRQLEAHGPAFTTCDDPYAAAQGADALLIFTEWPELARPDLARLAAALAGTDVFDGRNLLCPRALAAHGLTHHGVGRGATIVPRGAMVRYEKPPSPERAVLARLAELPVPAAPRPGQHARLLAGVGTYALLGLFVLAYFLGFTP